MLFLGGGDFQPLTFPCLMKTERFCVPSRYFYFISTSNGTVHVTLSDINTLYSHDDVMSYSVCQIIHPSQNSVLNLVERIVYVHVCHDILYAFLLHIVCLFLTHTLDMMVYCRVSCWDMF